MSDPSDIPSFLRRAPVATATAEQSHKPERRKKRDCFTSRVAISIPLDMSNADTLAEAITAMSRLKEHLPPGTVIETTSAGLGKMVSE